MYVYCHSLYSFNGFVGYLIMLFQLQRLYSTEQDKMIAQIVLDKDLK